MALLVRDREKVNRQQIRIPFTRLVVGRFLFLLVSMVLLFVFMFSLP